MEDTTSLVVFAMFIAFSILLLYITYEPIKRWAWSDVKQNKNLLIIFKIKINKKYIFFTWISPQRK